jgi:flavin-dependent dehydrogenase
VGARIRPVGGVGDERDVRARIVVAADGRRSCILRAFDPRSGDPSRTTSRSWFGLKLHLASAAPPFGRVELHIFDGGYAGVAAVEGDRINLCLLVRVAALRACGGSPDRLLRERILANPAARDLLERATPCGEWKSIGPLRFGVRRAVAGGAFLVGDAAGTVDPFSGEGMANALQGARLALPFVLEAAANGGMDARLAREYRKAWTSEFRPVTRRVRGLGFLFGHPGLFAATLAALSGPAKRLLPCIVASTRTELPRARR